MTNSEGLVDIVEFRTSAFRPFLPDDSQVNPGVYGAELAFWLARELASRSVLTSYPQAEDWGWFLEYRTPDGAEFALHCGNVYGEPDKWRLSLRRFARKLFSRDRASFDRAHPLIAAIRHALREIDTDHVVWHADIPEHQHS